MQVRSSGPDATRSKTTDWDEVDEAASRRIDELGIERVFVRTPMSCEAERGLCRRDLDEMERVLQASGRPDPGRIAEELDRDPHEAEFRDLEDASRDRAAEERLEELKRRMGRHEG